MPTLVEPDELGGSIAVVVDILRATTTIVQALAVGAEYVLPVADIDEARAVAKRDANGALLAGERGGLAIEGFDLGNSPAEFTNGRCTGRPIIFTTTNGTRALLHARSAARILIGAFVNYSAVCGELLSDSRDIHILCAGTEGCIALEDTVFAGSVVATLADREDFELNDSARIAWDAFEGHGSSLASSLELSCGGRNLAKVGLASDLPLAIRVDRYGIVAEASGEPPKITVSSHLAGERFWRTP